MKRPFYGWTIVGAASGMQFLQAGLMMQSFGAYVAVLSEERGWSKTALSGAAALHQMETALLGPVLGWLLDRFGPRVFIRAGIVVFGLGLVALSQIDTLVGFYAAFVMIALGAGCCGFFPLNVAIIHWFERWRSRAISTLSIGLAFGGIVTPVVAWSLATFGWRATALASGVIAIVVGSPLASLIYNRPADRGEVVDGVREERPSQMDLARDKDDGTRDFTAREALRTRAFWLISFGHAFALFIVQAVIVHSIAHLKEGMGYTIAEAALVFTLVTVSQIGGVAVGWLIGDRWDKRLICAACMLMHASGLLLLTYAAFSPWPRSTVVAFALLHGIAWGLRGPFMQAIRADYFGRSAIGMILGLSFLVLMIGQIGGPMIAGLAADLTGNYRAGFTLLAVLAGLGSIFFLAARKPPRPLKEAT
ncbi:MAG TPA: MFS transporter [Burkholderiales bacterium]|nr:MFS transporter [Burkholderiales bacterium]